MSKKSKQFGVLLVTILMLAGTFFAQVQKNKDVESEWKNIFSKANESAVFEDGKIKTLKLPIPDEGEKLLTFKHIDDKSFSIVDEKGKRFKIFLDESKKISSIIFPNGEKGVFNWKLTPNGYWVVESIKFDSKKSTQTKIADGDCYQICEDAAAYTTIAIGVCIASGGLSLACATATAVATYKTYNCYKCTRSKEQMEEEQEAYLDLHNKKGYRVQVSNIKRFNEGQTEN